MNRLIRSLLGLGLFVAASGQAAPIDEARLKGLAWLIQHQHGDGRWESVPGLEVAATAAAVEALANAGVTQGEAYAKGVAWLQNHPASSTDTLARQIMALSRAGRDTSALVSRLIAWRNDATKSWGAYDHFSGSFPDTSLAMDAIQATGTTYADAGFGIGFIVNQQNTDGGWPYVKGDIGTPPSRIIPTAHNLITLNRYKTVYAVQSYINSGIAWLKAQQKAGGGFGEGSTGTLLETALAYRALVAELGSNDAAALNAQTYLLGQQQTDGDWGGHDALLTNLTLAGLPATTLADTDNDGLPDGVETSSLLGTHPNVPDGRGLGQGNGQSVVGVNEPSVLPRAILHQPYAAALTAGGTPPHTWTLTAGKLPDGLDLNTATGQISGTPTSLGAFNFIYRVVSSDTQVYATGRIEVASPVAEVADSDIPTLPEWGMILMGLLLIATMAHLDRRKSRDLR